MSDRFFGSTVDLNKIITLNAEQQLPLAYNQEHDLFLRTNKPDNVTVESLKEPRHELMDIRTGDTVLDLGAWVGRFARWAFKRNAKQVISIEGDPNNYHILKLNRDLPSFKSPIQEHSLIGGCIWTEIDVNQSRRVFMSVDFTDNTSLHTTLSMPGGKRAWTNKIDIRHVLEMFKPDIIKIDVEGTELRLLSYHPIASLFDIARDVFIHWHIREPHDLILAKDNHETMSDVLGSCVLAPDFDVKVPRRRAYYLWETVSLYRNTYEMRAKDITAGYVMSQQME